MERFLNSKGNLPEGLKITCRDCYQIGEVEVTDSGDFTLEMQPMHPLLISYWQSLKAHLS